MTFALEVKGVCKRHAVGIGGCMASVDVLRGVSIDVHAGEAIAIVGGAFSGKSTLLLCASGLMVPESGEVRWFGASDRACAVNRATYHFAPRRAREAHSRPRSSQSRFTPSMPHLHLIDGLDVLAGDSLTRIAEWIERRRARGDAIVVATRDAAAASRLATRSFTLRAGHLHGGADRPGGAARVAERAW
jgi:predicted ABC-type transport system involved in lysophospholipase L1 biosynthesis ATPase subunit